MTHQKRDRECPPCEPGYQDISKVIFDSVVPRYRIRMHSHCVLVGDKPPWTKKHARGEVNPLVQRNCILKSRFSPKPKIKEQKKENIEIWRWNGPIKKNVLVGDKPPWIQNMQEGKWILQRNCILKSRFSPKSEIKEQKKGKYWEMKMKWSHQKKCACHRIESWYPPGQVWG